MLPATLAGPMARPPALLATVRRANLLAARITGRPYLSHSQISLMRTCPLRFSYQYVRQLPRSFLASSLLFGAAFHAALQWYFQARLEGITLAHKAVLGEFRHAWRRERQSTDLPIRFNKDQTRETLAALADRMLLAFLASPLAEPRGTIIAVEEELRAVLDPDLPDLLARVDLITQTDDAMHVVDWKTSRSRWTEEKAVESSDQLMIYAMTAAKMCHSLRLPVKLHFGVISKAKKPWVQLLQVPHDRERDRAMRESVARVWEQIQGGDFHPTPSPPNCIPCPFRSRCRAAWGR